MGKYKQWLHHQEVGRRLREQIATHEQERERVQRMAPSHPTTLPDTNNPLVRALLDYTGRGGSLGRALGTRISGTPGAALSDAEAHQSQPVTPAAVPAPLPSQTPVASTGDANDGPDHAAIPQAAPENPILAQLTARAAQIPSDPLEAMRSLAQAQAAESPSQQATTPLPDTPTNTAAKPEGNTPTEWWQNFRTQS